MLSLSYNGKSLLGSNSLLGSSSPFGSKSVVFIFQQQNDIYRVSRKILKSGFPEDVDINDEGNRYTIRYETNRLTRPINSQSLGLEFFDDIVTKYSMLDLNIFAITDIDFVSEEIIHLSGGFYNNDQTSPTREDIIHDMNGKFYRS